MKLIRPQHPHLVVVTPVYNEEAALPAYEAALRETLLARPDMTVTVLLVDDGSGDRGWPMIEAMHRRDPRFRGLRLSRNFGPHVAIAAAVDAVVESLDADALVVLACDLQDPPETVVTFVDRWRAGADIVWGARRTRVDSTWRIWFSRCFEAAIRRYAMPRGSKFTTGSFLLMDRRVADCFRKFREHSRVTFALVAWTGFDQDVVAYDRRARVAGSSGWSPGRLLRAAYDTFIAFSDVPAKAISILGAGLFLASMLFTVYLFVNYFLYDTLLGWTGIMVTLTIFFGVLFMMVGVMAEYLQRIFIEAAGRPIYFLSERAGFEMAADEPGRLEPEMTAPGMTVPGRKSAP